MGMASNTEHIHGFFFQHRWQIWPLSAMFLAMPVVQTHLQIRMFTAGICIQAGALSLFLCVNFILLLSHARHCFLCSGMTGDSDSSPSPRQSIVLDPAPSIRFSKSTIMAALYTIMVTLIKVPSPDPFPG